MLEIEIFPENVNTSSRTLPGKDGKPGRTMYEQTAYVNLGGKFPVQRLCSLITLRRLRLANIPLIHPATPSITLEGWSLSATA